MIAVIDYGMGNLRSVHKALEVVGARAKITSSPKDLEKADKIVFPGVGSFGEAMKELKRLKLDGAIKEAIAEGKPFLGLCLGLQLLFEKSEEARGVKGLSVLKGGVKRFRFGTNTLKVPHMGWDSVEKKSKIKDQKSKLLKGIPDGAYMYFVHSYYVVPKDKDVVLATTDYGMKFVSAVRKDNIYGLQFHPEKSQRIGLEILRNFVRLRG